jgi:hypothetical protein
MHPSVPMVESSSDRSLHPYLPPAADFTDGAREYIRRLGRAARDGTSPDRLEDGIRAAATSCAMDARVAGARAEQFVVALKREWSAAADSAGVPRQHAMEIATRLVTAAIVDFFRGE